MSQSTPTALSAEELDRLEALVAKATALAPLPWSRTQPETWINSGETPIGGRAHVADVRGWGYLTGRGHALAMESDPAFEVQKAWGDLIVAGVNALPAFIAQARRASDPTPTDTSASGAEGEWVTVPRAPTEAMIEAARLFAESDVTALYRAVSASYSGFWGSMLAAAPTPALTDREEVEKLQGEVEQLKALLAQRTADILKAQPDPSKRLVAEFILDELERDAEAAWAMAETEQERVIATGLEMLIAWQRDIARAALHSAGAE